MESHLKYQISPNPKITCYHLNADIGKKRLLTDISFSIPARKITTLLGPNGSGKTTLLKCLCTIGPMTSGKILYDDASIFKLANYGQKIAFVPHLMFIPFDYTVMELLLFSRFPWHHGFPKKLDLQKSLAALGMMGIIDFADRHIHSLSQGEQQKVFIARAFAQDTETIILDEPFANLDIAASLDLLQKLKDLSSEKTICFSIHDVSLASHFSDYVIFLENGRVINQGYAQEQFNEYNLSKTFGTMFVQSPKSKNGWYLQV